MKTRINPANAAPAAQMSPEISTALGTRFAAVRCYAQNVGNFFPMRKQISN